MKEFGPDLSIQSMNDPEDALDNLMECLLISFCYSSADEMITFVSDYPLKSPGSTREFIMLVFSGVSEFERESGNQESARRFHESYETGDDTQAVVLQSVRREALNGKKHLKLWFGPNFGGLSFNYGSLRSFTRGSISLESNGSFQYRDVVTHEPFDFYRPFLRSRMNVQANQ